MSKGTPLRTVRVDDTLWAAAQAAAAGQGENLSDIIRAALRAYVKEETFADRMAALSIAAVQHDSWKDKQNHDQVPNLPPVPSRPPLR